MDTQQANRKTTLSLHEAAQLLAPGQVSVHDAEMMLAQAIECAELHANIKRWATEQWEGNHLPGNINRLETFIERADLEAWHQRRATA